MIDLSKYEKVYEWDHVYGLTMIKRIIASTVIYLIKIGDDCYIDDTYEFSELARKHLRDLARNVHSNEKMQEAYNKLKACEFYILAQAGICEHPEKIKQQFIDRFSPSLNMAKFEIKPSVNLWRKDKDDAVEVKVKVPYKYMKRMKELSEEQGIPIEKFIQASAVAVLNGYTYRNNDYLMQEGVAIIDNALCGPCI